MHKSRKFKTCQSEVMRAQRSTKGRLTVVRGSSKRPRFHLTYKRTNFKITIRFPKSSKWRNPPKIKNDRCQSGQRAQRSTVGLTVVRGSSYRPVIPQQTSALHKCRHTNLGKQKNYLLLLCILYLYIFGIFVNLSLLEYLYFFAFLC